jgi:hypothetical protein
LMAASLREAAAFAFMSFRLPIFFATRDAAYHVSAVFDTPTRFLHFHMPLLADFR